MAATRKSALDIERTINLIELVHKYPSIWDSKDVNYYKKDHRSSALQAIAAEVGSTVEDVEGQWRSLRSSFGRQLKKIAEMNNNDGGTGTKKVHRPRWIYFKYLEFLRDTILPRKTSNKKQYNVGSPLECQLEFESHSELETPYTIEPFNRETCNGDYGSRGPYETDEQQSMSCGGEIITRPACSSTSFKEEDEASDYGASRKKRKTSPAANWEKEDALVNLAASQFCTKKTETASTRYGHWIGAVLDELPPAARLEVIHKINNIIHETQLNLL